jgi:hypothetical protein
LDESSQNPPLLTVSISKAFNKVPLTEGINIAGDFEISERVLLPD